MTKIDIFSGFLGAGKTTLIQKLIREGYVGEKLVLAEDGGEVLGLGGLLGHGVERRGHGLGKIGGQVVPPLGDLLGIECDACVFRYCHERTISS